jgi:hypothetical protein
MNTYSVLHALQQSQQTTTGLAQQSHDDVLVNRGHIIRAGGRVEQTCGDVPHAGPACPGTAAQKNPSQAPTGDHSRPVQAGIQSMLGIMVVRSAVRTHEAWDDDGSAKQTNN